MLFSSNIDLKPYDLIVLPPMQLLLRRANVSRKGGPWSNEDYDVFDGERNVGRVYLVDAYGGNETWFGA